MKFRSPVSFRKIMLAGFPALLLLSALSSYYWLLHTSSGASWLLNQAQQAVSGSIRSSPAEGDLASGVTIQNLEYRSDELDMNADRFYIQAGIGWWPLSIEIQSLNLAGVAIHRHDLTPDSEALSDGQDIREVLSGLKLPVPVRLISAVVTDVTLREDDEPTLARIDSASLQAALDQALVVHQLEIIASGSQVKLEGQLLLEPPFAVSAKAAGHLLTTGLIGAGELPLPFRLDCTGNLDKLQLTLTSEKNGLRLDAGLQNLITEPVWDLSARLDELQWPPEAQETISLSDLGLVSQGHLGDWSFQLNSALQIAAQDNKLVITGSGSENRVEIKQARISGQGVDLGIEGYLQWTPGFVAGLSAEIQQLDLSPWLKEWPVGEYLAGELDLQWSETGVQIPTGRLTVTGSDMLIDIGADIDTETNHMNARLDWRNLAWPLKTTTAGFSSASGNMAVGGTLDEWRVSGEAALQWGDYPAGRLDIRGAGDRSSMQIEMPAGEVLGGSISGEAKADWSEDLIWDTRLQTRNIHPEQLLPAWPGRLDADFEIDAEGERIQFSLVSLQGLLRGISLSGNGSLISYRNQLTFNAVEILMDDALLQLDGGFEGSSGLKLKFEGVLPSELLDGARGNLQLDGRYSVNNGNPVFDLQLEALDLAWNGYSVKTLSGSARNTETGGVLPVFQMDATKIFAENMLIDRLSLAYEPDADQKQLKIGAASKKGTLNAMMTLAPENTEKPFNNPWNGVLEQLEIRINQAYRFELLQPGPLHWSDGSLSLGPLCLHESRDAGLCLSGNYQNTGGWSVFADITALPVDYLRDLLELDVRFEQLLEGHLEWHQAVDRAPAGGAEFRITAGRILDSVDDELLAQTRQGRFAFSLQNGNLESGILDIEFPGTGFIDIDFDILDITAGGAQSVQGRAIARLDDINLLGQLAFPSVDNINGKFESNIQLGGTVQDPAFIGGFVVSDGLIHYAPIGLKLEDIEIEGRVERRDEGSFTGQFRAGEGMAAIDGRFLFRDFQQLQADLVLKGDQLLVVDTDTLNVLAEVDLKLGFKPKRTDIQGHIAVPSARLTPTNLLQRGVNDSEDLVIETGSAGVLNTETAASDPGNRIYGQLEVTLGDDVSVRVPEVETRINGQVLFDWQGDPLPIAECNYTVNGKVAAYGQSLIIENGSINFPEIPADNPLLNIRAQREIFGNSQIRSAGVQVIGTLKRPVVEAYTVPVTNEDRAWSLLITGTDYDQSEGIGSFNVGTYIAPKLFVSYGFSLFDDENVISARYDLKKGFGVKFTSGQSQTGLDISYTIDR